MNKRRKSKQIELLIEQLKKTPIVQIACEKVELSRATYYRWYRDNKKFRRQVDEALAEGSLLVNDMAESQLLAAIREQNLRAIIYWLQHHHPTYRNKLELSGQIKSSNAPLTPQQEKTIKEALHLANLREEDFLPPSSKNNEDN